MASEDLTVTEIVLADIERHVHVRHRRDGRLTEAAANVELALRPLRDLFGTALARCFGPRLLEQPREHLTGKDLCRTESNLRIGRIRRCSRWVT